jgi:rhodanese-related sulfurtransferase
VKNIKLILIVLVPLLVFVSIVSALLGAEIGIKWYQSKHQLTTSDMAKNYYNDEMASIISPVGVRALIDKKDPDYMLVDLRSKSEYESEHIVTAINIPAIGMDENQLWSEFDKLPKDKKIIVYCYSASCTLGRQVGQFLANKELFVLDMDVGWSEWKYYWGLWNPGENPKVGNNYVIKGIGGTSAPGICTQGKFGC